MDEGLRNASHDITLQARALLTTEAEKLLEGTYGLDANGALAPAERLPALRTDPEAQETRRRLEKFLADEARAGLKGREAVEKLIKEVAFTHLNRLVAFKMLEARKLTRQILARGAESNAFKFYLVEHPEEEVRWKAGDVDTAYRHFLLWQCAEMAKEIKVLFDPDNLASRLFPRPRVLKELLDMLNVPALQGAWTEDETIGWVYQDFNEKEKADVFERLYKQKQKIRREDIPAATQLFTPRWIVSWLVQNTLGRHWLQMHPDSRLAERLNYLVPLGGAIPPMPLKKVREVEVLDPACGTMHFGLVAFDLLVEMYKEELEKAGSPGWPQEPSVTREEDIPATIIAHNLFGIDIDLRAVQLSALALYLKAKSVNPSAKIQQSNLVCADVLLLDGERLDAFLKAMQFTRPIYERIIRALWVRLKDASHVGSLLRPEEDIRSLIQREREQYRREGEGRLPFPELQQFFEKEAGEEEFWSILEAQIIQAFDEFARQQAQQGADETYFVGEATKGMRLLDIMRRRYDVVLCNPPYSGRRNMNETLRQFLKDTYPKRDGDLFSAFISRCLELTSDDGRCGMVTIHTFMFVSSYEEIRKDLIETTGIETVCHLGTRTEFDVANKTAQGFVAFTIRKDSEKNCCLATNGTWYRLVEANETEKRDLLERELLRDRSDYRFSLVQKDLTLIDGWPWAYWISNNVRQCFSQMPALSNIADPKQGLATADNGRFLRAWWEIGVSRIKRDSVSAKSTQNGDFTWYPYMKGGDFNKWYGNQDYVVNWKKNGLEIKNFYTSSGRLASRPQNESYYFQEGVTYTFLTVSNFNVRYLPNGFIFDVAGSSIFPKTKELDAFVLAGILNSKLATFFMKLLNPTVNYQVGDLARIPVPIGKTDGEAYATLRTHVRKCVSLKRRESRRTETTWEFCAPLPWLERVALELKEAEELATEESAIDELVYDIYGITEADRKAIAFEFGAPSCSYEKKDALDAPTIEIVKSLYLDKHNLKALLKEESDVVEDEDSETSLGEEEEEVSRRKKSVRFLTLDEICRVAKLHPSTVVQTIRENKWHRVDEDIDLAHCWISYAMGVVMDRFQPGIEGALGCAIVGDENGERQHLFSPEVEEALRQRADNEGVAVLDPTHKDGLPRKVEQALLLMLGEEQTREIITAIGGEAHNIEASLRLFLERDFFTTKVHLKWYQKRPIYWLLQSPRKTYSVYLYHERVTQDTLPLIRGSRYLEGKINQTRNRIKEAHEALRMAEGKNKRKLEKDLETLQTQLTDLEAFDQALQRALDAHNERGETVGWAPEIDDGVILNLAPLHELLPSWKTEPKKYWEGLEKEDYDWSHTAMRYWPNRVLAKCRKNKSYAIAHDRLDVYEGDRK